MVFGTAKQWLVTLDGQPLNHATDSLERRCIDVEGWHSRAPIHVPVVERTYGPGAFAIEGRAGARVLAIVGQLTAVGRDLVAHEVETLDALAPTGHIALTVTDRTLGARTMTVQCTDAPEVVWRGGPVASYRLPLYAASPFKYGTTSTGSTGFASEGSAVGQGLEWPLFVGTGMLSWGTPPAPGEVGLATVVNPGTATAWPVFKVTGPAPAGGFEIVDTTAGFSVRYLGDLPAGSVLVIDTADGSAAIDETADRTGDLIVTGWPSVPPGGETTFRFAPLTGGSSAVLTVEATAAYW
ncbi:MAG: phage tail family protein [Aeromicrobium sp.]|uniref:phage distal tail protein n=1 Tax=Aeromicrobium sp. TaxID=1871063 RepID=UPI0039E22873